MHKEWVLMNFHKTNLYFVFLNKILHTGGRCYFLRRGSNFSLEDIKRISLVCAGHHASPTKGWWEVWWIQLDNVCLTSCSVSVTQIPIRKHRLPHSSILCLAWSIQHPCNRCWGMLPAGTWSQSGPAHHGMGWRRFTSVSYLISHPHLGILLTPQH